MRKTRTKPQYVNRTPGLRCQDCGAPMPQRAANAKYCYECSHRRAKERTIAKREREQKLIARDTAQSTIYHIARMGYDCYLCPECTGEVSLFDTFCRYCGQRLKIDEEEMNYAFTDEMPRLPISSKE